MRVTTRHRRESVRTCVCSATSHIWHLAKRNGLALQRRPRHAAGLRRLQGEGAERGGLAARSRKEAAHLLRPIRVEAPAPLGRHLPAKAYSGSHPRRSRAARPLLLSATRVGGSSVRLAPFSSVARPRALQADQFLQPAPHRVRRWEGSGALRRVIFRKPKRIRRIRRHFRCGSDHGSVSYTHLTLPTNREV